MQKKKIPNHSNFNSRKPATILLPPGFEPGPHSTFFISTSKSQLPRLNSHDHAAVTIKGAKISISKARIQFSTSHSDEKAYFACSEKRASRPQ